MCSVEEDLHSDPCTNGPNVPRKDTRSQERCKKGTASTGCIADRVADGRARLDCRCFETTDELHAPQKSLPPPTQQAGERGGFRARCILPCTQFRGEKV